MTRRMKKWIAVAACAVALLFAAYFLLRDADRPRSSVTTAHVEGTHTTSNASSILATVRRSKQNSSAPRAAPSVPDKAGSVSTPDASAPAEDPQRAQLRAIQEYENCYRRPHTDAEIEQEAARQTIVADKVRAHYGQAPETDPGKAGVAIALGLKEGRDACAAVSGSDMAKWRPMLEDLASSGYGRAQVAYASAVWHDSRSQDFIDADPADFNRRLELARDYLWDNVNGNCDGTALNVLWRVPQLGPAANYIGWSILGQAGLAAVDKHGWPQDQADRERADLMKETDRLRSLVPPDQVDDANQTIAFLQQNSCAGQ